MKISGFFKEYRFLSNFWVARVSHDGLVYPTVEHAYQAAKSLDHEIRVFISELPCPADAKKAGKLIEVRHDWESVKLDIMKRLVWQKFSTHVDLADKLLYTGDAELIEQNTWGDTFWGVCDGLGKNHLGRILMNVRQELTIRTLLEF